jgi:hypothetical protein
MSSTSALAQHSQQAETPQPVEASAWIMPFSESILPLPQKWKCATWWIWQYDDYRSWVWYGI